MALTVRRLDLSYCSCSDDCVWYIKCWSGSGARHDGHVSLKPLIGLKGSPRLWSGGQGGSTSPLTTMPQRLRALGISAGFSGRRAVTTEEFGVLVRVRVQHNVHVAEDRLANIRPLEVDGGSTSVYCLYFAAVITHLGHRQVGALLHRSQADRRSTAASANMRRIG